MFGDSCLKLSAWRVLSIRYDLSTRQESRAASFWYDVEKPILDYCNTTAIFVLSLEFLKYFMEGIITTILRNEQKGMY